MSANDIKAYWQAIHFLQNFRFGGTQVHEDAVIRHESWQSLNNVDNCWHRSCEDKQIHLGKEGCRVVFSVVNDFFGKSKFECGEMRVESNETCTISLESHGERAAHESQSKDPNS